MCWRVIDRVLPFGVFNLNTASLAALFLPTIQLIKNDRLSHSVEHMHLHYQSKMVAFAPLLVLISTWFLRKSRQFCMLRSVFFQFECNQQVEKRQNPVSFCPNFLGWRNLFDWVWHQPERLWQFEFYPLFLATRCSGKKNHALPKITIL